MGLEHFAEYDVYTKNTLKNECASRAHIFKKVKGVQTLHVVVCKPSAVRLQTWGGITLLGIQDETCAVGTPCDIYFCYIFLCGN